MSVDCHLVLLARWPRRGRVKTRLAADCGHAAALALHGGMVADGRRRLDRFAAAGWTVRLLWDHDQGDALTTRLARHPGEGLQEGPDLGARMARAMADAFSRGARACVLLGTDSPTLADERVREARDALAGADVVFGPADDGGYYLVAARGGVPPVFGGVSGDADIAWGTASVLDASLAAARRRGLRPVLLAPHYDVDRPADLARLRRELRHDGAAAALAPHTRRALREIAR